MKYAERRKLLKDVFHGRSGDDHSVTVELADTPDLIDDLTQHPFRPEAASLLYCRERQGDAWGYLTRIEFFATIGTTPGNMVRRCVFTSADRKRLTPPWVIALLWEYCPSWYVPEPAEQGMPLLNSRPRRLAEVVPLRPLAAVPRLLCGAPNGGTAECDRELDHKGIHRDKGLDVEWW